MAAPHALTTHPVTAPADPRVSGRLMVATYAIGGITLFVSFLLRGSNDTAAAYWAAAGCVGTVGIMSFARHSVFHRSDAARMGWDYGRRNDFQIEVGIANLAFGAVGILTWVAAWGPTTAGAVTLAFGLYMLGATLVHAGELRHGGAAEGARIGSTVAAGSFAVALIVSGVLAVAA
ncbi:MAG: DUF6790 family protein [Microthrixaceae bacterium]